MAQKVGAKELPDVFDRVEFGRLGRQWQKADVVWDRQSFAGLMPAGAIEHQHGVSTGCHLHADFTAMFGHGHPVDYGQDDGRPDAAVYPSGEAFDYPQIFAMLIVPNVISVRRVIPRHMKVLAGWYHLRGQGSRRGV
ncbi:hypothetical protein [Acidiphilium acidophilum]|uniref:hypothetical protein n=1 Tax=Acidiphilium acidophilum TaxID=76588 RepID=UPI0038CF5AD8